MTEGRERTGWFGEMIDRVAALATGRSREPDPSAALVSAAEKALVERPAGPTIPNVFIVAQGTPPDGAERSRIQAHLEEVVALAAVHRGRRFDGPISVTLAPGDRKPKVEAAFEAGELPPWGRLQPADGTGALPLTLNRSLIGRSKDADVIVSGQGVSRVHALMWREMGSVWIADLQSANGSRVNGDPVYDVVEVRRGDAVQFGNATFVFEPA